MLSVQGLTAFIFLALSVRASDTPPFQGELLLQPGLNNAKCLTATSNSDGAAVTIQTCSESAAQKWTFTGGTIQTLGNKCLDVTGGNSADGTTLQIWTCSANDPNQQFSYTRDNRVVWANNKCMDLTGGNQGDGTPAQIWDCNGSINQVWNAGYSVSNLPQTSQNGQYGINNCGTGSDPSSNCQTLWINSASDFCLWAPPQPGAIGDTERIEVAHCTKSGRGARTFPDGTLSGVHFVKTPDYVQVTGVGDFTKINIPRNDSGGELDNRGADGNGNPIGGLVYGNSFDTGLQYHDWTSFISDKEFCIRACVGPHATSLCNHIYDLQGCYWNMPASYDANVYEDCVGDSGLPMGVYGTSTWYQGTPTPAPAPHPVPSSSNCQALPTVTTSPLRRRHNGLVRRHGNPSPTPFSAPTQSAI